MSEGVSEWVSERASERVRDQGFKSQLTIWQSYRDWNKVYQAQWLGLWTKSCLYVVCMYWTHFVLVRPAANLYSANPLKHHATGKQWCPNQDHYPDSEPANRSLTYLRWALSRAAEPQILTSYVWRGRGSNQQPHAYQANAEPIHYTRRYTLVTPKGVKSIKPSDFMGPLFHHTGIYFTCCQIREGPVTAKLSYNLTSNKIISTKRQDFINQTF